MKISNNTKKTPATKTDFQCEFCNRYFQKETALMNHLCESKRRWQDKDLQGNRIGFQCWLKFYAKNSAAKKERTYTDFVKSAYYLAFVKFGHYCVNIKCINVTRYADWLLKSKVGIDYWCSDKTYDSFLIEYLRDEDPLDALARSIETTIELAAEAGIQSHDYLRYGNANRILHLIVSGKISPWMLYQSESGVMFLENLNEAQQKMILEYISPEQWAVRFKRYPDSVAQVSELLSTAGY
jgi:hypothetical protein